MLKAVLVQGLAFGDEGKGATIDYLCRQIPVDTIVRFNGGCQAAHAVVTPEGIQHTFSQFGSGSLASPTVKTYLSRYMLFEPYSFVKESMALDKITPDVCARTFVDGEAVVITPIHQALNRFREEMLADKRHGSCGRGIGVARELEIKYPQDVLRAKHLRNQKDAKERLRFMFSLILPEMTFLGDALGYGRGATPNDDDFELLAAATTMFPVAVQIVDNFEPTGTVIFEGAQGVMLDETHGTAPHNTWTNCTFGNADTLCDEWGIADRLRIGCLRSYYTRHGAGPLPTEEPGLKPYLPEPHNSDEEFAGRFRVGKFDYAMCRKALKIIGGVDYLAISHLDRCMSLGLPERLFLDYLWSQFHVPVGIYGRGPKATDRAMSAKFLEQITAAERIHV